MFIQCNQPCHLSPRSTGFGARLGAPGCACIKVQVLILQQTGEVCLWKELENPVVSDEALRAVKNQVTGGTGHSVMAVIHSSLDAMKLSECAFH